MRTFVAVEITDSRVLDSIKKIQSEIKIGAKPIEINNLHFTLMFLGEITEEMEQKIKNQLSTIEFFPFEISFKGLGAFPKPKFPRVIWIGLEKGGDELVELARNVENKLGTFGFRTDNPFKPHVTIFRMRNRIVDITEMISKYSSKKFGNQTVNSIKFKQSILTPRGPIYSDIGVIRAK